MDTVSESSMAASASEASPSSTTTTPRSTSTPLSAPPSPAASPSHPTPSSNLPLISSIPVTISPLPPAFSSPRTGTPSAVGERGGWGGGGCVQCERCGEDSGFRRLGAAVVGGRWGFHGGRGDGDEVRLGLLKVSCWDPGSWLVGTESHSVSDRISDNVFRDGIDSISVPFLTAIRDGILTNQRRKFPFLICCFFVVLVMTEHGD
ncbi:hypothetical protein Syun_009561 [Stephania yunnanensis]|uniref:Uncharacterized protein n=1 Tax=Stephania yunnanensis TaxID=152371 RepID=A0AAP0PP55_9MAGN